MVQYDRLSSISVATHLTALRYYPIPIAPNTKACNEKGWTKLRIKAHQVQDYWPNHDIGVGVLLGIEASPGVFPVAIDIDEDNPVLIEAVAHILKHSAPCKKGSKGVTYFARMDEAITKKLCKRKGSDKAIVEILGEGQQTVIPPSWHPLGHRYEWLGPELGEFEPHELPLLTEWGIKEIRTAVENPDSNIFLLNSMEPSGHGEPGTIHNSVLTAVATMVGMGFPEDAIWDRVDYATRFADPNDRPGWEATVRKMAQDATEKGFDKTTASRRQQASNLIADWFLDDWRGPNAVYNLDGLLAAYDGGYYHVLTAQQALHIIATRCPLNSKLGLSINEWQAGFSTIMARAPYFPGRPPTRRVCLMNGTFDMDTGQLSPWSKDDLLISRLPFSYDPDAVCPVYNKFVARTFKSEDDDGADAQRCYEEFVAMTLFECLTYHKFLVLKGIPRSGKSTLVEIACMVHAKGAVSSVGVHDFANERQRTFMVGKLLNVVSEVASASHASDDFLKLVTAGDRVQVRQLYQAPMSVVLPTRIMIACNEMFRTRDTTGAIEKRMLLLVCDNQVPDDEQDVDLKDKLRAEVPGIFNRLAAAWVNLRDRGKFITPRSHIDAVQEFTEENNHVLQWVRERTHQGITTIDPEYQLPDKLPPTECGVLYLDFAEWSKLNGFMPISSNTFGARLTILNSPLGGKSKLKRIGKSMIRVRSLTLTSEAKF